MARCPWTGSFHSSRRQSIPGDGLTRHSFSINGCDHHFLRFFEILFSKFNYEEESRFFISTMERKYGRITENVIGRMWEFMEQKKNGILSFIEVDHTLIRRDARTITIYAKKNDACFSLVTFDHRMTAAYWWGVISGDGIYDSCPCGDGPQERRLKSKSYFHKYRFIPVSIYKRNNKGDFGAKFIRKDNLRFK